MLAGRSEEAAEMAAEAFEIFEAKGDVAGAAQFRVERLAGLGVDGRLMAVVGRC